MKAKKKWGLLWIGIIAVLAFYFSNGIGLIAKATPWSLELKLAKAMNSSFHPDVCINGNPKAQAALKKFIARLYPLKGFDKDDKIKYDITFIHNDQVNAFATLGGEIFVLSGLLRDVLTPEELAGVIAHEMAHVSERHVLQGILVKLLFSNNNFSENFFNIGFTRGEESEADSIGLERLKNARIDALGYYQFFNKHQNDFPQWLTLLSDHPGNDKRKALAQKYLGLQHEKMLEMEEWQLLKNFCH